MVHREVYGEVPPRVEYSLTELGKALNTALMPLGEWDDLHMKEIVTRKHPGLSKESPVAAQSG
ncbi:winged helix-turn-helix transcriptional regulator [Streptomyces sp. NPDC050988]|uniref:winged helix-turn-helix transcriptional regulator n=1 Tax=Streptomyces sp. NPDC050988 TaxID=3365637 RepID=UPI00378F7CA8